MHTKKTIAATMLTLSTLLLASCTQSVAEDDKEWNEETIQEVLDEANSVKQLDIEDSLETRQEVETLLNDYYYDLATYKPGDWERGLYMQPTEPDTKDKHTVMYQPMEDLWDMSLELEDGELLEDKMKEQLDEEHAAEVAEMTTRYLPSRVDVGFQSLNAQQKAFVGVTLGNMKLYNAHNFDTLTQSVIEDVNLDKIIVRDKDIIVPRNAISFSSELFADNETYNAPLRIVNNEYTGLSIDFYTTAQLNDRFRNSLEEVRYLYEEESPRLVDEILKEQERGVVDNSGNELAE